MGFRDIFKKSNKLTLEQCQRLMDANDGNLFLIGRKDITELPDGLTVKGRMHISYSGIKQLPNNLIVNADLDISDTAIIKIPGDLIVKGSLCMRYTNITEIPDNCQIGGHIIATDSKLAKLPNNLAINGNLDLRHANITELHDGLIVGGFLDLWHTPINKLPDGLVVGGSLDLSETPITELPDDLVVGGNLYLSYSKITKLPDGLVVGGQVYFNECIPRDTKYNKLTNGTYVPNKFIYVDGILTHVRNVKHINGYTIYVGKIKGLNVITDGTYYAHCANLHDGMADLQFKALKDRGANQYKHLTLDDELSATDMITMYRIITGACKQGTIRFINSLGELKDKYTIREAIELTNRQYGSEKFAQFFGI